MPSTPRSLKLWRRNWARVVGLFSLPEEIRKAIYTTNVVESLNMTLCKVIKNRPRFPTKNRLQADLPGVEEHVPKMAICSYLAHFAEPFYAALGRPD